MSTKPTDGASSSTGQYVRFTEQWENKKTSSDSSGMLVSDGSTTSGTRKASNSFSETQPLLGRTPVKGQKLSSMVSTSSDSPAAKKTTGCTKGFFKGLIKEFKAKIKQFQIKHQHIQHRDQIAQNPHSAKLGKTLSKFLGRARVDMSKEKIGGKLGKETQMQTSKYEVPDMTSSDIDNLNQYFAEESIDSGVDALVDLYKGNNLVAFQGILKALTPENRKKVIDKLHQFNDGDMEKTIFKAEKDIKTSGRLIDEAVSKLKDTKDAQEINAGIEQIREQAILMCPNKASPEVKQDAVAQAFTAALKELTPVQDHKEANQALSFALGQEILQPLSGSEDIARANDQIRTWAEKGKDKTPGNCGKDLFRFSPRINIVGKNGLTPIDRSDLPELSGTEKDKQTGLQMINILNQVNREITGIGDDLITPDDIVKGQINSQEDASRFAENFSTILERKKVKKEHKEVLLQFISLIGMQEIPTRVGDWTIPGGSKPSDENNEPLNNYRKGAGSLQVAEFSAAYSNALEPLQYARTMDFKIRVDGKFELQVYSPITFQDISSSTEKHALGTCGVVSTLIFDSKLEFETMSQQVVPAEIH